LYIFPQDVQWSTHTVKKNERFRGGKMKNVNIVKILALLLAILLLVVGCSPADPDASNGSLPDASDPADSTDPKPAFDGKVVFGVTAAKTGTTVLIGEQVTNGAILAAEHINANGGILGKELVLVFEDEIDNQQASVNAMTKLMEYPDIMAFYGSTASGNCIAVSPTVLERKIPMLAGGSSANIPKEGNPYVWQARMTDDQTGLILARVATEELNMKNPAILFSTESFGTGLKDQVVAALANRGVNVKDSNLYGYTVDEKNLTPIITQIQNSDADGLIAIAQQNPAIIIAQQVDAAGLDIPLLGSASFSCVMVIENAGASANDWYTVCEWVPSVKSPKGAALVKAYQERFGELADAPTAYTYDSVLLFAEACRIANSTTDREAINEAFKQIKDFEGAMSTYTYFDNHSFSTSLLYTYTENGVPTVLDYISGR